MIQIVVMDKSKFITEYRDFNATDTKEIIEFLREVVLNTRPDNSIIEISKWIKNGERV